MSVCSWCCVSLAKMRKKWGLLLLSTVRSTRNNSLYTQVVFRLQSTFLSLVPFGLIVVQLGKHTVRQSARLARHLFPVKLTLLILISTAIVANRWGKRSFLPTSTFIAILKNLYHKAVLSQRWGEILVVFVSFVFFLVKPHSCSPFYNSCQARQNCLVLKEFL